MNAKGVVRVVLLLFVGYSLIVLAAKHSTPHVDAAASEQTSTATTATGTSTLAANRIVVYYFHGRERCENCQNLEAWAKETVEATFADKIKAGQMEWQVVDFSQPQDAHYDQDFKLGGLSCVAVAEVRDGALGRWKVLDEGLMLAVTGTKAQVVQYIERELHTFIQP